MWIDALQWYFFFCLVTSLGMVIKTIRIFFMVKPGLRFVGTLAYFLTTWVLTFLFAPIFFLIFLAFSSEYEKATIKHLTQGDQA